MENQLAKRIETREEIKEEAAPKIFDLLEKEAPIEEISSQITEDFYGPNTDMERVFLGIQGLIEMGKVGLDALRNMRNDSGKLEEMIGKFISNLSSYPDYQELENLLGIKRVTKMVSLKREVPDEDLIPLHQYAVEKGYFRGTLEAFSKKISNQLTEYKPQLSGMIDEEVLCISSSFGPAEPSYCEMMGPRLILEMRKKEELTGLLIGSMGEYSAKEFSVFLKKINKKARPVVVDNNQFHIKHYARVPKEDVSFIIGDGLELPMKENSVDLILTNDLLHNLTYQEENLDIDEISLEHLFTQMLRVLKPNGKILLFEQNFIPQHLYHIPHHPYHIEKGEESRIMEEILTKAAESVGLTKKYSSNIRKLFAFRKDISKTQIDKNGFAHYGDNMLMNFSELSIQMVFQKST